ncbi:MAG TPA: anthranilate phosphoribosyltransferase [Candidatus Eisenbacteria bacterium]|nr:anthranilate phosphoribosyltransferase [Candidatus Eisenbacteria bacterium]
MIAAFLPRLERGERLSREETAAAVRAMVGGEDDPAAIGAFLRALAARGEAESELLGGAEALRAEAIPFDPGLAPLLDTCGTGGDGSGSFNVSTAVAFVAAAAGAPVAKHGNRSVSSRCGSADVLEALGAVVDLGPEPCAEILRETGFCFLYARRFHPAVGRVAPVRQALGIRTLFNWLGPLANPARATHQLLGVSDLDRVETVARVLAALGTQRALVVHGGGGVDELSLEGENVAMFVEAGAAPRPFTVDARALGFKSAPIAALQGGDAVANAGILRHVFSGERGAARDAVVLNAAAALWVAEKAADLAEGARLAARTLDDGSAGRTLDAFIAATRRHADGKGTA